MYQATEVPSNASNADMPLITMKDINIITLVPLSLVLVVGVFGNALCMYVFGWRKRKFRNPYESLLLILAVNDFFSSMIIPLLTIYGTVTEYKQWHFGTVGCKILPSTISVSVTISEGILLLIAFERHKSIISPLRPSIRWAFNAIWLAIVVCIAIVIVSPYTYSLHIVTDKAYGVRTCLPNKQHLNEIFIHSIGSLGRDLIVTIAFIIMSTRTAKAIHRKTSLLETSRRKRLENSKKARKILVVVVVVFSACVLPLDLFQTAFYSIVVSKTSVSQQTYQVFIACNAFLTVLQVSNSATNIVIYSRMHQDFKRGLFAFARRSNRAVRTSINRITFRRSYQEEDGIIDININNFE